MFDLPKTNVRLREFRPADEELIHTHLLNVFDLALRTELRFPIPTQMSNRYANGAKKDAEMCCIIETIVPKASAPASSTSPTEDKTEGSALKGKEVEEQETPEFIGFACWRRDNSAAMRQAVYSISIRKEYSGKGIGTEVTQFMVNYAFEQLNMVRVHLGVFAGNVGARRLYEKAGFVQEVLLREHLWRAGTWEDLVLMSILVDEWREKKTKQSATIEG